MLATDTPLPLPESRSEALAVTCNGPTAIRHEWFAEDNTPDFRWVINGSDSYAAVLKSLPDVLAWNESRSVRANVRLLGHSVCLRRAQSFFDFVGLYDSTLSRAMRECFEALPTAGQARFIMAPETVYLIWQFRKSAPKAIVTLCNFLNAESARHQPPTESSRGLWTALGDYYAGSDVDHGVTSNDHYEWTPGHSFSAPYLGGTVPIDFFSPNVARARDTTKTVSAFEYLEFTSEERSTVCRRLEDAFTRIARVSEPAAALVREFVKVIIPFKVPFGMGSTSKRSFPGRVVLRGIENATPAVVAEALVHEATHQFLYILEYEGRFAIEEPDNKVQSAWTGRALALDAFIHASFVWYGLTNFWVLARASDAFDSGDVDKQLTRCLSGFQGDNPVDALTPYAGMVRIDVLRVASQFQQRLHESLCKQPV